MLMVMRFRSPPYSMSDSQSAVSVLPTPVRPEVLFLLTVPLGTRVCRAFEPLAGLAHLAHEVALALPPLLQIGQSPLGLRLALRQVCQPFGVVRPGRALPFEHAGLHGDIVELPRRVFERSGNRVL